MLAQTIGENEQLEAKNSLDNIEESSDEEANTATSQKEQFYRIPKISKIHYRKLFNLKF